MTTATLNTTVKTWLQSDHLKKQIAQSLPKHCTAERFMRVLFTSMQRMPKLMHCTQESLFSAFMSCSQLGIEPDGRRAHLIPYKNNRQGGIYECQLIVDYKGLVELALRSGKISNIHADVVCTEDDFEFDRGVVIRHRIDFQKPRGDAYAAYAIVSFKDGTSQAEVMSHAEIESIRQRSRAGRSGPWVTDWNEMAKKTVFRRLAKWLPLAAEERDAIELDDDQFDFVNVNPEAIVPMSCAAGRTARAKALPIDAHFQSDPEAPTPFVDALKKRCKEAGISFADVILWARSDNRQLDPTREHDARKILNSCPMVAELIKTEKELSQEGASDDQD